ncbi:Putative tyrosine-protein kinase in cps region [Photobacterium malacitanum]|uniref:non-specific protein-tyrosine kinase n=1 Tax=Photobacterium malacitanum TaxID=2204294 RepID=A0A1Y6MFQ2_9GAMM|nr:Putative tyrosine-protein kinase in cps region [Photobacterium malacitanum]
MSSLFVDEGTKLESTIDFSRFIKSAKKNWWKVLAFSVITTGAMTPLVLKMPPKYEAFASVYLKANETKPTLFEQVRSFDATRKEYYETQYQLIKARRVAASVVDELKLYNDPEFYGKSKKPLTLAQKKDNSVDYLLKHLTVSAVRKTQLVDVGFESEKAALAAEVANSVVQSYINYTINDNRDATDNASVLLGKQIADLKADLQKKEDNLNAFLKKEHLITFRGIDGFQTSELSLLNENLAAAVAQRVHSEAIYKTVTNQANSGVKAGSISEISRNPQMENLRVKIIDQRTQLSDLEKRYGAKNEKVIQAKSSLAILQQQANVVIKQIVQGIKEQYQAAVLKENQLQDSVNKMTANFQKLGDKKTEYNNLVDGITKTRKIYNQLIQRQNETEVNGQFVESAASMIDPALIPEKPTKPNKKLLIAVIAIMSLLIATIFFVILAAINNKVLTISEIKRRLGLEILGEIKHYKAPLTAKEVIDNNSHLPCLDEAAFGIRSAIHLLNTQSKMIAVSSTIVDEGTSTVSALLAKSLAVDSRVLVVDLDFRTKALTKALADPHHVGMSELITHKATQDDCIIKLPNFDFIGAGDNKTLSPLVLLTNNNLKTLFAEFNNQYDYIIFDTPAVEQGKDAALISQLVDGVIFVVESNHLSSNQIVSAINQLQSNKANLLGCVLNKVNEKLIEAAENINPVNVKGII